MSQAIPHVGRYMSICPFTIGQEQTLIHAHLLMRAHDIRHLPVLHEGKLAGVIAERDLHMIEAIRHVDPEKVRVEEVMATNVYSASPDAPLDEVVHEMAKHKYGCTVIMEHGAVVGVFTSIDAMEALSGILVTWVTNSRFATADPADPADGAQRRVQSAR
jgi:acetoin utilization protein AcuB